MQNHRFSVSPAVRTRRHRPSVKWSVVRLLREAMRAAAPPCSTLTGQQMVIEGPVRPFEHQRDTNTLVEIGCHRLPSLHVVLKIYSFLNGQYRMKDNITSSRKQAVLFV